MSVKFSSSNADIIFRSVDGVEFNLHRALLEANTGAFPGPEIDTHGEVIDLQEPAIILEILFDYVHPKRHSDLADKDIDLVFALAEAVEKYEVFSAMLVCNARLRNILPQHSEKIVVHAVKHNYPDLINDAAPHLPRSSFISAMEKLPTYYSLPWSRYHESWTNVFKKAREYTKNMPLLPLETVPGVLKKNKISPSCHDRFSTSLCVICQNSMFLWITSLEEIDTTACLKDTLERFPVQSISDTRCCRDLASLSGVLEWVSDIETPVFGQASASTSTASYKCGHMSDLVKFIQDQIKEVPPFSKFVNG